MRSRNQDYTFVPRKTNKKNKMKAVIYKEYGTPSVLKIEEIQKPAIKKNEILVKIMASAANSGDCRIRRADPFAVRFFFGLVKPKLNILGGVLSGEIEAIGEDVKLYNVGDKVFGSTDMRFGAYAEYKSFPETATLALKPVALTHTEAAVIPFGGATALHFLKKANIKPGQKVLIVGASGAVGTAAVQLAKSFGAIVTGVSSTTNLELVKSLGADKVIDYTIEDFADNGEIYDVIFDTVNGIDISRSAKSLASDGKMILSNAGLKEMLQGQWLSMTSKKKVITGVTQQSAADMNFLRGLVEAGKLKPVIDKTYKLSEMSLAHTYVETGRKKGNVAIDISMN